jgi:hypothetical protein
MEWIKVNADGDLEFVMEEVKLVPEIQTLLTLKYNKDTKGDMDGRKKYKALNELKYMYLVYSPKSPYRDYLTEKEKIQEAKNDCNLSEHWVESPELKLAIAKYIKGSENKTTNSIKIIERFLDKFSTHLENIQLDERNASMGLVHDPGKVMTTLEKLPSFLKTLEELEKQSRLGLVATPTSKGDHELGWMAMNKDSSKKKSKQVEEQENN